MSEVKEMGNELKKEYMGSMQEKRKVLTGIERGSGLQLWRFERLY